MNRKLSPLLLFALLLATTQTFGQKPVEQVSQTPSKNIQREHIYMVVEEMPRFPGCEDLATKQEKSDCSIDLMLDYIYSNLQYPEVARKNQTEGTVVLRFVVGKDGVLKNIRVVFDIGDGCGQAARKVIEKMNEDGLRWIPGKQRGKNVQISFTLPVKFKLKEQQVDPEH